MAEVFADFESRPYIKYEDYFIGRNTNGIIQAINSRGLPLEKELISPQAVEILDNVDLEEMFEQHFPENAGEFYINEERLIYIWPRDRNDFYFCPDTGVRVYRSCIVFPTSAAKRDVCPYLIDRLFPLIKVDVENLIDLNEEKITKVGGIICIPKYCPKNERVVLVEKETGALVKYSYKATVLGGITSNKQAIELVPTNVRWDKWTEFMRTRLPKLTPAYIFSNMRKPTKPRNTNHYRTQVDGFTLTIQENQTVVTHWIWPDGINMLLEFSIYDKVQKEFFPQDCISNNSDSETYASSDL